MGFHGSYRYSTSTMSPNIQEDIGGIAKGCQKGARAAATARCSLDFWLGLDRAATAL